MSPTSRTLVRAGAVAAVLVFGSAGAAGAASPPSSASVGRAAAPTPASSRASMPGMDDGSMPGMDDGSMPGMAPADGAAGTGGHDAMPDMAGVPSMPGMSGMPESARAHQEAATVSRPLARVVGAFVVVNGLLMAVAAVLRRRRPARRGPRRPHPAAA